MIVAATRSIEAVGVSCAPLVSTLTASLGPGSSWLRSGLRELIAANDHLLIPVAVLVIAVFVVGWVVARRSQNTGEDD